MRNTMCEWTFVLFKWRTSPNLQVPSKSREFSSKKYISNTEAHHEAALNKFLDTNLWEKKTVKSLKSRSLSDRALWGQRLRFKLPAFIHKQQQPQLTGLSHQGHSDSLCKRKSEKGRGRFWREVCNSQRRLMMTKWREWTLNWCENEFQIIN